MGVKLLAAITDYDGAPIFFGLSLRSGHGGLGDYDICVSHNHNVNWTSWWGSKGRAYNDGQEDEAVAALQEAYGKFPQLHFRALWGTLAEHFF